MEKILPNWVINYIGVSENSGVFPPNHPFFMGFSIINHPFGVPLFLETPIYHQAHLLREPSKQLLNSGLITLAKFHLSQAPAHHAAHHGLMVSAWCFSVAQAEAKSRCARFNSWETRRQRTGWDGKSGWMEIYPPVN